MVGFCEIQIQTVFDGPRKPEKTALVRVTTEGLGSRPHFHLHVDQCVQHVEM